MTNKSTIVVDGADAESMHNSLRAAWGATGEGYTRDRSACGHYLHAMAQTGRPSDRARFWAYRSQFRTTG